MGWNFIIDDSSSYIKYHPAEDSGLGNNTSLGWAPYWEGAGGFLHPVNSAYGTAASGQSLHVTALDGASLSFESHGTGFCLYGTSSGTFDVTIDDVSASSQVQSADDVLYCQDDLQPTVHYVNLTAHSEPNSNQQLRFDYASVAYDFTTGTTTPSTLVYNDTDVSAFHYMGKWNTTTISGAPSTTSAAPLHKTSSDGASASIKFTGEAVAVYGFRTWGSYLYNITLDDEQHQYNGSTLWELLNSLLFFRAGLSADTSHNIEVTYVGDESYYFFYLNSITAFSANATDDTPKLSPSSMTSGIQHHADTRAIIGGVVGGVGGLLLIIGLVSCLWRRRPSPYDSEDISPFTNVDAPSESQSHITGTSSSILPLANGTHRPQGFMGKRASLANTPVISQNAQAQPVAASSSAGGGSQAAVPSSTPRSGPRTPTSSRFASTPPVAQPVTVDRIIELIAERIDRRTSPTPDADGDAPPRYPDSTV
ncbi:uncharacterized protein C8Q71DRAFT_856015 [Rhodofomes roseus]|uniref:Uncharacterized protein n=1 Tax=Rhodofomes roseus TaxID=34475 RepID=A0ABQ8KM98_9APHY|nr:uncharacterized protein C8Q71DRAFT_856015 [Rhodofomes roseus]KAH9839400.1 hypothetical protein C8Q71DRAFT_856015 [Rhodofomes roseus]